VICTRPAQNQAEISPETITGFDALANLPLRDIGRGYATAIRCRSQYFRSLKPLVLPFMCSSCCALYFKGLWP
jgi:hypothetical protein